VGAGLKPALRLIAERGFYDFIYRNIKAPPVLRPSIVYHKPFPPQPAIFPAGKRFSPALARALEKMGVRRLYSHQVAAIENVRGGKMWSSPLPRPVGKR